MGTTALALFAVFALSAAAPASASTPAYGKERLLDASPVADRMDPLFRPMTIDEDAQAESLEPVEIADETVATPHLRVIVLHRRRR